MNIENHEFMPWPKMARLSRECLVTEKLDGTNACVNIVLASEVSIFGDPDAVVCGDRSDPFAVTIFAGSRTRWIKPGNDNYGFAAWVLANHKELARLGPGRHFGEWWGHGIQRRYNIPEKRFSLFNTGRFVPLENGPGVNDTTMNGNIIKCCSVVPVLYRGAFNTYEVAVALEGLRQNGSVAAPGFMQPEGIIIYHVAGKVSFKKTLDGDAAKGPDYPLLQKCSDALTKAFVTVQTNPITQPSHV